LELQARALLSRNHAFMELGRYYPGCFALVDMANPLQLAQTIYRWQADLTPMQRAAVSRYNIENNVLLHQHAFRHGAESADAFKMELIGQAPAATPIHSGYPGTGAPPSQDATDRSLGEMPSEQNAP